MGSGRHSSSQLGGHSNSNGGRRGAAIRRCARAAPLAMLLFATPIWAHSDATSDVVINHDVLNNLGLSAPLAPGSGAGQKAAKLRPPPGRPPRSRLLVQPVREAARTPAAASPGAESPGAESPGAESPGAESPGADDKPAQQLATASEPTAAAKISSAPVVSEPAPVGRDLFGDTTAAPSFSVPAVPPPPEPADSPSSGTMAIVPPPPPPEPADSPSSGTMAIVPPPPPPEPADSPSSGTMAIVPPPPPPSLEPPAGGQPPSAPEPAAAAVAAAPGPSDSRDQTAGQPGGKQVAARPAAAPGSAPVRLRFEAGSAELTDRARRQLTALKDLLLADDGQRVQLRAYARGGEQRANAARRLSLSRARAVRAFLAERGVATSRVDVRALGAKFKDGPPDRVDVVYARR